MSRSSPAQSEFYAGLLPVELLAEPPPVRPTSPKASSRHSAAAVTPQTCFTRLLSLPDHVLHRRGFPIFVGAAPPGRSSAGRSFSAPPRSAARGEPARGRGRRNARRKE